MAVRVTDSQLAEMNALRKMTKAFPGEADKFKARKKDWWAKIRDEYNIPKDVKLSLGLETGVILDKDTGQPWEPPAAPPKKMWLKLSSTEATEALIEYAAHLDVGVEVEDGTFIGSPIGTSSNQKVVRDGNNNFFVELLQE